MENFTFRHVGPTPGDFHNMVEELGFSSISDLIDKTIPQSIRLGRELDIEEGTTELEALNSLRDKLARNKILTSMLGQGYHDCVTPPVLLRNLFENPGWYTSYTPYQPEISQGRLELLFQFQTLVSELAGLPVANASLLDEGTAIAEAIGMAHRHHRGKRNRIVIANSLHPQSIDVARTRAAMMGMEISFGEVDDETAAVIIQWPDTFGEIEDPAKWVEMARAHDALMVVAADPMALVMLEAPGKWGADIVVGSMQRYGVPMGNGGPHAAYMAVTEKLTRIIPGRLVGESIDTNGNTAYRLALQTREQHIRREKATSNICTAQALLANMAVAFAIWHGAKGLLQIAREINARCDQLAASLEKAGFEIVNSNWFDTLTIRTKHRAKRFRRAARDKGILIRQIDDDLLSIAVDETTIEQDLIDLCAAFDAELHPMPDKPHLEPSQRGKEFLTQEVFHKNRSETAFMRYLRELVNKDLALDRSMIPLGSCTMKLNAAAEMIPVSWPEIANIHPFAPEDTRMGYNLMIDDLDRWLSEITGFARVSFQPNAGSQGEFAGLIAIRRYLDAQGENNRRICLIPASAHGTNPASAHMAGMDVVVVAGDENGNVDIDDLKAKAEKHKDELAALMITYPSTHGVFEESIVGICSIIHDNGGQVYLDGANLNAMVGLARPGDIGADVCHMNLHKTFCIPHGGGGPGVGPIGVAEHLIPYLPGHVAEGGDHAVAAAPNGSASILPISWMYIRMLGAKGLREASETAILNANYLALKLSANYDILYRGSNGFVAHECIIDTRPFKDSANVSVDDIAKRLMDYGFHAPTMSWPVAGTLMIEPTESEPREELDRFVEAMASIRGEIRQIETGKLDGQDNPLHNAPHTAAVLLTEEWKHPYSRLVAADPAGRGMVSKYWPPVGRVDNVHGDRNLVCTCPPIEMLAAE